MNTYVVEVVAAQTGRSTMIECHDYHVGGVNVHISKSLGYIPYPHQLKVVNQFTKEVKAEWVAGAFQVY